MAVGWGCAYPKAGLESAHPNGWRFHLDAMPSGLAALAFGAVARSRTRLLREFIPW